MRTFRFDTETYPIRPGRLAPARVCVQSAVDWEAPQIELRREAVDRLHDALTDTGCLLEAHNGAYDQVVTSNAYPDLLPLWFRALGEGRGRDTMIREKLINNARGILQDKHPQGWFSLAGLAERYCGVSMAKGEDTWRLKYALLDDVPPDQWPSEARKYAEDDVLHLRAVSHAQTKSAPTTPDEWFQVAAAFALQLTSAWGLSVDPEALAWVEVSLLTRKEEAERLLADAGFFNDGSVDKKRVQRAVEAAYARTQNPPPRTNPTKSFPSGQTKTDAETIEEAAALLPKEDPQGAALHALVDQAGASKLLSTYVSALKGGARHHMTCTYNVLAATGRTTSQGSKLKQTNPWWPAGDYEIPVEVCGTNAQNWPQAEGIRDCVVPREGFYFASVDYNSLELRTLGQACLWLLGRSTFAEGYRKDPNWDPHAYMGGVLEGITYEEALRRTKEDKRFKKGPRALGKALNFSLAGGVGARRFSEMAMAQYAAGFLTAPVSVEDAYRYKEAYLTAYPEMRDYFDYINWLVQSGTPLTQFVSNRVRGGVEYTSGANSFFQGLAADLAKRAVFQISRDMYCDPSSPLWGSRIVAFIHDEIVAEVPKDRAHEAAMEIERMMCAAFSEVCPDVPPAAEAALMTRWVKAAAPRHDARGRLIPWDL